MKEVSRLGRFGPLAVILTGVSVFSLPLLAEPTDYKKVGMYVGNMLQQHHYSRHDFDDEMSRRLLNNYLDFLDFEGCSGRRELIPDLS